MPEGNLPSEEEIKQGEKAVDILQQLSDVLLDNLDINRQNVDAIKDSVSAAGDLAAPFIVTREAQKSINKSFRQSASFNADIVSTLKERVALERNSKEVNKDLDKGKAIQKKLLLEQSEITKKITIARKMGLKEGSEEIQSLKEVRAGLNSQVDIQSDINNQLNQEANSVNRIEDAFGLTGKSLGVVNKLLGGALPDLDKIKEGARDQLGSLEKEGKLRTGLAGKMQGFGALAKSTGSILKANMLDPLTLIKAGLDFDAQTTKLQKNLALSGKEAYALNYELAGAAAKSGEMAIGSKDAAKSFGTLNSQIGIASTALAGMAGDAAVLQKLLGLSDEAIGNAGKASLILGKSIKDVKLDIIDSTTSIRTQSGIALDYNKIIEKTLNVTGQIAMQLGNNPKEIAKAVAQANALGMELEQVAKVGQSLLSFEQSIEAELEAELLTGKELNLEKARLLALTGDYEALSREIAEQAGTFTEYSAMNVIQQQKLAEAFGMSANEMSDMLIDQEAMGKTAEQLRAEGKEDIAQRIEARNAQEKFTDAVEKMKGVFVDLVGGPIGALLNMLTLVLEPINFAISGATKLAGIFTGAKEDLGFMEAIFGGIALTVGTVAAAMKLNAMYTAAMGTSAGIIAFMKERGLKATIMEGPKLAWNLIKEIGIAAAKMTGMSAATLGYSAAVGLAAGLATYALIKANDGIFEGGGYGKRALLDEGSITLFNDRDTIVAGTNLNKADDMVSKPAGSVQTASPQPIQPVILQNEVVYDSHQSANYYNGPRSTEKSETGIHA
jgi:hypothetical protein